MFATEQHEHVTNIIQAEMDKQFLKQTKEMEQMLETNEADKVIQAWSSIVEQAVPDAGQIKDPKERTKFNGHGDV